MAETKEQKAHRLVLEGRLTILEAIPSGKVVAECRGLSGSVYKLGWDPSGRGRWGCTCEASHVFHRECSHLLALKLVVSRARPKR